MKFNGWLSPTLRRGITAQVSHGAFTFSLKLETGKDKCFSEERLKQLNPAAFCCPNAEHDRTSVRCSHCQDINSGFRSAKA